MIPLQVWCGPEGLRYNSSMTATLEGVSGHQHATAAVCPRGRLGTHFTGGWVGPRASLDVQKN